MKANLISGFIIPNTERKHFDKWYLKIMGRKPTEEEYTNWKTKIEQLEKDINAENIPNCSFDEFIKILGG